MSMLITIDPSINNLGLAVFDIQKKRLVEAVLLRPQDKKGDAYARSYSLYLQIRKFVKKYDTQQIVSETPDHWHVAGFEARESGAIDKLVTICGMIYTLQTIVDDVQMVIPRNWKKQFPKEVMKNRIEKYYVPKYYDCKEWDDLDHNIRDAIGIGHWKLYGRI